jgi:hypothetical protein
MVNARLSKRERQAKIRVDTSPATQALNSSHGAQSTSRPPPQNFPQSAAAIIDTRKQRKKNERTERKRIRVDKHRYENSKKRREIWQSELQQINASVCTQLGYPEGTKVSVLHRKRYQTHEDVSDPQTSRRLGVQEVSP